MQCDHMRLPGAGSNRGRDAREFKQPDDALNKIFLQWQNEQKSLDWDASYELADRLLGKLPEETYSVAQAHALLVAHLNDEHIKNAGLFVSAVYNKVPDKNIVYDLNLPTPTDLLGYKLPKHKTLTNTGTTGNWFGWGSLGVVLNTGTTGNWFGHGSSGVLLNTGTTGTHFGWWSSGLVLNTGTTGNNFGYGSSGLVLNTGTTDYGFGGWSSGLVLTRCAPKSYGTLQANGRLIKPEEYAQIQGLDAHITTLTQQLTNLADVTKAAELQAWHTANPPKKIRREIEKLLRGAGNEV